LPENEKINAIAHLEDSSVLHIKERYREGKLIKYLALWRVFLYLSTLYSRKQKEVSTNCYDGGYKCQ